MSVAAGLLPIRRIDDPRQDLLGGSLRCGLFGFPGLLLGPFLGQQVTSGAGVVVHSVRSSQRGIRGGRELVGSHLLHLGLGGVFWFGTTWDSAGVAGHRLPGHWVRDRGAALGWPRLAGAVVVDVGEPGVLVAGPVAAPRSAGADLVPGMFGAWVLSLAPPGRRSPGTHDHLDRASGVPQVPRQLVHDHHLVTSGREFVRNTLREPLAVPSTRGQVLPRPQAY